MSLNSGYQIRYVSHNVFNPLTVEEYLIVDEFAVVFCGWAWILTTHIFWKQSGLKLYQWRLCENNYKYKSKGSFGTKSIYK